MNIGWGKSIKEALTEYDLPTDHNTIKNITRRQWTKIVKEKIEIKNLKKLLDDCHKTMDGNQVPKRKTAHIIEHLIHKDYQRKPLDEIMVSTKQETKTLIIARFRMLECGRNLKGSLNETCTQCNVLDDENHRMNYCIKFRDVNFYDSDEKMDFKNVYSKDKDILQSIIH